MSARKVILGMLDAIVKVAFVIVVVILISKYSKVAYDYGYRIFNQVPVSSGKGRTVSVTIVEGDSTSTIAEKLASAGLITDKNLFKLQEQFSDYHGLEAPGSYELSTSMTPEEMLQVMAAGATNEISGVQTDESSGEKTDQPEPIAEQTEESSEESKGD